MGLLAKFDFGSIQRRFVLLPLFFPRPGEGLTDGVARYFGQVVVFGDVLVEQFVLADNPWD